MDDLIAAIVSRTRDHPDIARGASVRGAIAFKEILSGFTEIHGSVTPSTVERAAVIALAPRISARQGGYEAAAAIVRDIVREVLYGREFSGDDETLEFPEVIYQPSLEDILSALEGLEQMSQGQDPDLSEGGQIAVVPDERLGQEAAESQYLPTKKAIEHLLEELERKLMEGEISEEEYRNLRGRLSELLEAALKPRYEMSGKELSETVLELMDGQDKQWGKDISFKQMYIYYHMKSTREGKQLSAPKRGYHELRALIDDLAKRGVLGAVTPEGGPRLTALALNTLLEYLLPRAPGGRQPKGVEYRGRAPGAERTHDIRRYGLGDVYRDISVRHTLREIARQKKKRSDVNRRDMRVFSRHRRRLQTDIVLCVDTSGSMGFRQKLTYARLVAAGLVRAGVENGDRVGIIAFDDLGKTVMPLSDWKQELMDYIAQVNAGGNTNIGDGIQCAVQLLLRQKSRNRKYIVLITDGQPSAISESAFNLLKPTRERDLAEEYAILETRRAASSGVRVSVVHTADGQAAGDEFVKDIAAVGGGQVWRVSCLQELKAILQ